MEEAHNILHFGGDGEGLQVSTTGSFPMQKIRTVEHAPLGTGESSDDEEVLLPSFSKNRKKPFGTWTCLARVAMIALCASFAAVALTFGLFGFWMGVRVDVSMNLRRSRPLKKLDQPTVILLSFDGFRWDYPFKGATPSINRMKAEGTEVEGGISPIFPSVTLPNHYTLVTGLYAESHGIIANDFRDPRSGEKFNATEAKWWMGGEPIWITAKKQHIPAATIYWPGSNVKRDGWDCDNEFCKVWTEDPESAVPGIDAVLSYFDGDPHSRPQFIAFYYYEPDHTAHQVGPDAPQTDEMIARVDGILGRLMQGLEERGILDDIDIIVLADHGMVGTCGEKTLYLEDVSPFFKTHGSEVTDSVSPFLLLHPPAGTDPIGLVQDMVTTLQTMTPDGQFLTLFYKEDIPDDWHYRNNQLIAPVIGVIAEGYSMRIRRNDTYTLGQHGYLPTVGAMHPLFVARGPRFAKARTVLNFNNTEVYGILCELLGIKPMPNNGTPGFAESILLPL